MIRLYAFRTSCSLLALALFSCYVPAAAQTQHYDVVIAGAGTGGSAAAIQAARLGARVALLEESDWIGGQMAAAGVGTMDEGIGPESTPPSGLYAELLDRIKTYYKSAGKSIDTCYWNSNSHCFDPQVARKVLTQMIDGVNAGADGSQKGHIDLFLEDRVVKVLSDGDTVTGVVTSKGQTLDSSILIDATEYGDVLPLTPARYRSGKTIGPDRYNSCTQAITWTATIRKYPDGVPPELQMHNPPPGYDQWVDKFRHSMRVDGNPVNRNLPVSFPMYAAYRAIPDLANPEDYTAVEPRRITRTSMNWFNDFNVTTAVLDRATRKDVICEAKLKTLADLYYLQHEGGEPLWSVANDEGYDTAYNRANACPQIPAEYKALEYNLPQIPYIRESNRLVGETTLTGGDIRREHSWGPSVIGYTDGIAVGNYADDLHGCNNKPEFFEQDLEHITDLPPGFRFGPFQVPLRALIPEKVDGLLAAEKNISQSRIANGATRLQPITMLTGQAAGALAGLAIAMHRQPRAVPANAVQLVLLRSGDILAREHMADLPMGTKQWQAAQFAIVHQWVSVDGDAGFQPSTPLTRAAAARILVSALLGSDAARPVVDNTGGFDPPPQTLNRAYEDIPLYDPIFNVVAVLHAAGAVPPCAASPQKFCPDDAMTLAQFLRSATILLSRQKDAAPATPEILLSGIKADTNDPVTRGQAVLILFNAISSTHRR
jgi:FAD dependent oxidoreductase